ncbi:MAG TPA: SDR family NAD(P)-dependent oxidoreductase [Allosphingosinicella sp.]|nr:SDR family NAD(P)-dependent oxidoreductase [Allosphingosinicella sp.]
MAGKTISRAKSPASARAAARPLARKTALITGSVQGIGLATAHALAALGAKVMLTDITRPADLNPIVRRLRDEHGTKAAFECADLTSEAQIDALVRSTVAAFGSLDILVNNAAVRTRESIETIAPEDWRLALAVNLTAPFHLIRGALPHMRTRGWGRIVNIASGFGLMASQRRIDYVTTKTGMIGMTKAVALDLTGTGITCNAVCPGSTWTPRQQGRLDRLMAEEGLSEADALEKLRTGLGASVFLPAESIAASVAYLCGDSGAYVTGIALPVDGGHLAGGGWS